MVANILDVSFAAFSTAVEAAGYKPVQYSKTGYFVKTANNVRIEFQCTRGGVNSVGYGSSKTIVDLLELYLTDKSPLKLIARITGSINYQYESLEKFIELALVVEGFVPPVKAVVAKASPVANTAVEPAKVPEVKVEAEKPVKAKKDVAAIKAANLARLKDIGSKLPSNNVISIASDVPTLLVDNELTENDIGEMPAFLMKDAVMQLVG